jgi:predicted DNA-binding protein
MRKKSQNTVQKNFPISPELDKKLKKHSQKTELSEAYLIREAIKKYLCENIPTSIMK